MFHSVVYETHEGRTIYPITGFETRDGRLGVLLTDMEGKLVIWQTIHMGMRVMPTEKTTKLSDFKAGPSWKSQRRREFRAHMRATGGVFRCPRCGEGIWDERASCRCNMGRGISAEFALGREAMNIYKGMEH